MTSAHDSAEEMDAPGDFRPQAAPRRRAADWAQEEALGARSADAANAPPIPSVERSRFPFSIVWSPLPVITWFLPIVGHMGITDSRGVIYDCEWGDFEALGREERMAAWDYYFSFQPEGQQLINLPRSPRPPPQSAGLTLSRSTASRSARPRACCACSPS